MTHLKGERLVDGYGLRKYRFYSSIESRRRSLHSLRSAQALSRRIGRRRSAEARPEIFRSCAPCTRLIASAGLALRQLLEMSTSRSHLKTSFNLTERDEPLVWFGRCGNSTGTTKQPPVPRRCGRSKPNKSKTTDQRKLSPISLSQTTE